MVAEILILLQYISYSTDKYRIFEENEGILMRYRISQNLRVLNEGIQSAERIYHDEIDVLIAKRPI